MKPPRQNAAPLPDVVILLCTLNGARWLPEQLQSLVEQSHKTWALWISDDGSTDGTGEILAAFRTAHGGEHDIRLLTGPRQGAAQNFLFLLTHPELPVGPGTHVALCDQDDIWMPEKLARGLTAISTLPPDLPAIYGAQSIHIDEQGRRVGQSRRPRQPPDLGNAVVQNMVSGHSTLLNPAATALARQAGYHPNVPFQDWWLSLLVIATGGRVMIDGAEVLFYRQHGGNVLGAPQGLGAQLRRIRLLLRGSYAGWIAANLAALAASPVSLTPEARALLDRMATAPRSGLRRLRLLHGLGIRRQSGFGTLCLHLAGVLGLA